MASDCEDKLMELSVGSVTANCGSGGRKDSESGSSLIRVAMFVARLSPSSAVLTASGLLAGTSGDMDNFFLRRGINFCKCLLPFRCFAKTFRGCLIAVHSLPTTDENVFDLVGSSMPLEAAVLKRLGCSDDFRSGCGVGI